MKTVLKIGLDALPNAELARFTALFPVAETRTQVAWVRVRAVDADVVVCHRQPWRGTRAVSLCLDPSWVRGVDTDLVPLEPRFRVLSLIAALDRAAERVLARRGPRGRTALACACLRHWWQGCAARLSPRRASVLASDWTATGGSLSFAEVDELLSELREHGEPQGSGAEPLIWLPAKPGHAGQAGRSRAPGVLKRLRGWFGGAGTAQRSN